MFSPFWTKFKFDGFWAAVWLTALATGLAVWLTVLVSLDFLTSITAFVTLALAVSLAFLISSALSAVGLLSNYLSCLSSSLTLVLLAIWTDSFWARLPVMSLAMESFLASSRTIVLIASTLAPSLRCFYLSCLFFLSIFAFSDGSISNLLLSYFYSISDFLACFSSALPSL